MIDRPGMQDMLRFLRRRRKTDNIVILIDEISRLARDIKAHLDLRTAISDAGGLLESPSIEFGEDSDSILVENLLASVSQHQRQKNAEQVVNRMKARVMAGYYVFAPVVGYRYESVDGHGKMLVPDEPNAGLIREALEGFACGRFQSPAEVQRFLNNAPTMPKGKHGEVRLPLVIKILGRSLYAGYITVEKWGLYLHPAKHEPLVSFSTWKKIQDRLNERAIAPERKDLNADFPLRGFVTCGACDHIMTAAWTKGRNDYYPYYFCQNRHCSEHRKSIRKETTEGDFEDLLHELKPTKALFKIAYDMMADMWKTRIDTTKQRTSEARAAKAKIERKIEQITDRLIAADSDALVSAYETWSASRKVVR